MRRLAALFAVCSFAACRCVELPEGEYRCDPSTGGDCEDAGEAVDAGADAGPELDAGVDAGGFVLSPCTEQWCWDHPRPLGRVHLRSVFELRRDDVWAVGHAGNVLHYDGEGWRQVPANTGANLFDVWGFADDSVWIVGAAGTILEWDGQRFVRHDAGVGNELRAIAAANRRNMHVFGSNGAVLRYDGQWTRPVVPPNLGQFFAAAGWPDGGVLAYGDNGLRYSGGAWSVVPKPPDAGAINALWARSSQDIWAAGAAGGLWRNTSGDLDQGWVALDAGTSNALHAVFAIGDHGYWGSGSNGLWETTSSVPLATQAIWGIHGLSENDLWAVGPGQLLHRRLDGTFFDDQWPPEDFSTWLQGIALVPGGGAWAVGDGHSVFVRDGGTWSRVRNEGNVNFGWYYDVWASPQGPVVAVGGDPIRIAYWDAGAGQMSEVDPGFSEELWGVWGASPSDVWAVGQGRRIVRFDGGTWTVLPQDQLCPGGDYEEVTGTGPDDVWIVGNSGCVVRWDGRSFSDESVGVGDLLNGVATPARGEVFVASMTGRVWRRVGDAGWSSETLPATGTLHDLTAYAGTVWAAGDNAVLLRRDPVTGAWARTIVPSEQNFRLQTITSSPGEGLLAAGQHGVIFFRK